MDKQYTTKLEFSEHYLINSFEEVEAGKIYGVSLVFDDEAIALKINEQLAKDYLNLEGFVNKNSIDIVLKGCSKGNGVLKVKELYNIDMIGGIGDSYNDITLVKSSDIGFTFNDSPESLKNQAKYLVNDINEALNKLGEEK